MEEVKRDRKPHKCSKCEEAHSKAERKKHTNKTHRADEGALLWGRQSPRGCRVPQSPSPLSREQSSFRLLIKPDTLSHGVL